MKIYFLVATQHDNLGDLLINKMLIDEISKYGTVYVDGAGLPPRFRDVLIDNNNVKDFEQEYKGSLKRTSGYKLLSVVKSDFDYYFKSPGPSGGMGYDYMSIIRAGVLAYQFNYLSKGRIKLNSVGNDIIVRTKLDHWFQRNTNKAFENYLVRSTENRDQLLAMGYKNTSFIPDMAFLFNPKEISVDKTSVLLSFRDLKNQKYTDELLVYLQKCIDKFTNESLKIVFFHQVESDKDYNKFLYNSLVGETCIIEETMVYSDISNIYKDAKYVISNRLHVFLLGMRHEAIPLAYLNEDNKTSKISNIVKTFGLKENLVNVKTINLDENKLRKEIHNINEKQNLMCQEGIKALFN